MRIYKNKVLGKTGFVPADAAEQTLYNIFVQAFDAPVESVVIPEAKSFSDLKSSPVNQNQNQTGNDTVYGERGDFDIGDEGAEVDVVFSASQAEFLLLNLLTQFTDKDKIIILFQVVRSFGFHLTHEECAKTVGITRERYMVLLKNMKRRAAKILQTPAK